MRLKGIVISIVPIFGEDIGCFNQLKIIEPRLETP